MVKAVTVSAMALKMALASAITATREKRKAGDLENSKTSSPEASEDENLDLAALFTFGAAKFGIYVSKVRWSDWHAVSER